MKPVSLLIVEDDAIVAEDIRTSLVSKGYHVMAVVKRGEDVLACIEQQGCPNLILMDIHLKGEMDGVAAAHQVSLSYEIPIIYLTSYVDNQSYERAKMTNPFAFIRKPFVAQDLTRTIELVINKVREKKNTESLMPDDTTVLSNEHIFCLHDSIFMKEQEKLVKIKLNDILYLEADRNYSRFFTTQQTHMFSMPLKALEQRISDPHFVRTHRSYVANLIHLDEVLEDAVVLSGKKIPLSRTCRPDLLKSIKLI